MATENTIYIITGTDGSNSFAIQPRTIDGFGGIQQNTDLTLYGNGAEDWGGQFNTNYYKLLETFSCPDKGALLGGSPLTILGMPQDSTDLGAGLGINKPTLGQQWFNSTDGNIYVYNGSMWDFVGGAGSLSGTVVNSVNTKTGTVILDASDLADVYSMSEVDVLITVNSVNTKTGTIVLDASDLADVYSIIEVDGLISGVTAGTSVWGNITGTLSNQTDLQNAIDAAVTWGNITGTLSNQTDLQNAIDAAEITSMWGNIGGTLSTQIDLQNELNAKEPSLAVANQAEMELGLESSLRSMSPLRVKQSIDNSIASIIIPAPASADVGTATAGLLANAIGSYGLYFVSSGTPINTVLTSASISGSGSSQALSGSWRVMNITQTDGTGNTGQIAAAILLRIA